MFDETADGVDGRRASVPTNGVRTAAVVARHCGAVVEATRWNDGVVEVTTEDYRALAVDCNHDVGRTAGYDVVGEGGRPGHDGRQNDGPCGGGIFRISLLLLISLHLSPPSSQPVQQSEINLPPSS